MFFLIILGAMLGAAAVILCQQWRSGVFMADAERISLPPPSLVRPHGVARRMGAGVLRVEKPKATSV